MDTPCLLEVSHVTMAYGTVVALDDVSLCVPRGAVHALLGEDDAGKTTLAKIVAGAIPAGSFSGALRFADQPLHLRSLSDGVRAGISIIPRKMALFKHMSLAENIMVAGWQHDRRFFATTRDTERRAQELLDRWRIDIDLSMPVSALSSAQQRLVMILRALGAEPTLLILDEPLAGIGGQHAASQVLWNIRRIASQGVTCLYLTKRPAEAIQIAAAATVLRDGAVAGAWQHPGFDEQAMLKSMVSQRLESPPPRPDDDFGADDDRFGVLRQAIDRWLRPHP